MSDLSRKRASGSTKLVGSDQNGCESNYAEVTDNQEQTTSDILDNGILSGSLLLTTTAVEIKVGVTAKAIRKAFICVPDGKILIGDSTGQTFPINKSQYFGFDAGEATDVWAKAVAGTVTLEIIEGS